jgi:5,10-methylenetetrahydromethanopterin reductase
VTRRTEGDTVVKRLRLSVRLHGGIDPRRSIELAQTAEANGFVSVWFAENPFNRGVLPAAAACAAATRRVGIGVGVLNPYNRHPTLIAMEIGALDELAQGRARLGIGSGIATATERMGLSSDRPLAAVRDAITIVRAMLAGNEVTYTGRAFSAIGARLEFKALRPDLPLLMAARGEQALALCGKIADGLMISNMCPPEFTRHAVDVVRTSARKANRQPPADIVQYVPCAARPDRGEAYRLAKETICGVLPGFWSLGQRIPAAKSALLRAGGLSESDFAAAVERLRAGEKPAEVLDERFVDAFAIAGTAQDCLARARQYFAAGTSELVLSFAGAQAEEDMRYLGEALRSEFPGRSAAWSRAD